ncbi:MAG: HAMP domain-containing histidine kinase [Planctomycetes bacterium]|nr:HAMP domain-containing histidine kinase [Planctomycetota bacterium]
MPRARVLGVEVELTVRDEVSVHADGGKLRQVFFNLLQNALEASARGQRVQIEVLCNAAGQAEVRVCDQGIGIGREQLGRIYDPFFTTKQNQGGTGLGLSVCYGIIEEHGGHILAESQGAGQGSTFRVVLPMRRSDEVIA